MEGERKDGLDLVRGGQEHLALVHLVLLHLAEWCTEGPLRDLKGYTLGELRWI